MWGQCIDFPRMHCHGAYTATCPPTMANEWSTYLDVYDALS